MANTGSDYDEELDSERLDNVVLWRVIFVLSISFVILVTGYLNLKQNNIVSVKLPPKINVAGTIIYGLKGANITYYELWGRYLIPEVSNFDSSDISKKVDLIINEMRPLRAVNKIGEIDKFKQEVVLNRMSQTFTPLKYTKNINKEGNLARIKALGVSNRVINGIANKEDECSYTIDFELLEGVVYVKDFGTDCF